MRRGEIRWYRFASPDKVRPVLLLTRDAIADYLSELTIAPVSSRIRDIPSEVLIGEDDGMPRSCVISLDHLQTVPKAKMGALITTLPLSRVEEVRSALLFSLGFSTSPY